MDPTVSPTGNVAIEIERADALLDIGRAEQAAEVLSKVLARAPESATAWAQMSRCHSALGDHPAAIWAGDQAVRLAPGEDWAHRLRAHALLQASSPAAAVPAAAEAVRLEPRSWRNHLVHAAALQMARQYRPAWRAAVQARELAPDEAEVHGICGDILHDMADDRGARAAYEKSLSINADNQHFRHNLAVLDINRGRVTAASAGFGAALAGDPNDPMYQHHVQVAGRALLWRMVDVAALALFVAVVVAAIGEPQWWPGVLGGVVALAGLGWYVHRSLRNASSVVRGMIRRRLFRPMFILAIVGVATFVAAIAVVSFLPDRFGGLAAMCMPFLLVVGLRLRNHALRRLFRAIRRTWYRIGRNPRR
jgi:tetratricopeptide (TPR) repeat protein